MDRRSFVTMGAIGVINPFLRSVSDAQPTPEAKNIVLVHGLFADGSCWSEVIPRLQAIGLNVTSVPLNYAVRGGGFRRTRPGATGRPDRTCRPFFFGHDHH